MGTRRVARSRGALVLLLLAACGGGAPKPKASPAPEAAFPVTIEAANGSVTIPAEPRRIVSMSATATEILFAIGAGEQVVAVDSTSNFPEEAPTTDLSAYEPNAEAVAGYEPDLVVLSDDINEIVASLTALDIPVIQQSSARTLDDTYEQIRQLGEVTGNPDGAADVVTRMQRELEELAAAAPTFDEPLRYYHELDPTYYSVTSDTFIGQVYALAGLRSIADPVEEGDGYPQLSAEFIIDADPEVIFLADTKCCDVDAAAVAARPGWQAISAVQDDLVVELDDDVASRWGPRVVDLLRTVVERLGEVASAAA